MSYETWVVYSPRGRPLFTATGEEEAWRQAIINMFIGDVESAIAEGWTCKRVYPTRSQLIEDLLETARDCEFSDEAIRELEALVVK